MTSSAYFDPVQRYNPVMVNILLCLAYFIGIILKLGGVTKISWATMGFCILSSIFLMWPLTWLFKQGRDYWPRWDKQFAHIPASVIGSQVLLFWWVTPEVSEAVALVWFAVHSVVTGRLSVVAIFVYSSILMMGYYNAVQPQWAVSHTHQMADLTFMVAFIVLNLYLGVFSKLEAKRDAINIANQNRLLESQAVLAKTNAELERLSNHDPLTELYNRRGFNKYTHPRSMNMGILMIDIDDFKLYNDFFGHPQGDKCIQMVAKVLRECTDDNAILARHGGEEFVIALMHASSAYSMQIAEKIRHAVEARAMPHPAARAASVVTVSVGVAHSSLSTESIDMILKLADIALYEAKQGGRNQCRLFKPQPHLYTTHSDQIA